MELIHQSVVRYNRRNCLCTYVKETYDLVVTCS